MTGELDWAAGLATVLWNLFNSFVQSVFGLGDSSLLMSIWNFFPIVGATPIDNNTAVMLVASIGAFVAYIRWWR